MRFHLFNIAEKMVPGRMKKANRQTSPRNYYAHSKIYFLPSRGIAHLCSRSRGIRLSKVVTPRSMPSVHLDEKGTLGSFKQLLQQYESIQAKGSLVI